MRFKVYIVLKYTAKLYKRRRVIRIQYSNFLNYLGHGESNFDGRF